MRGTKVDNRIEKAEKKTHGGGTSDEQDWREK